MEHKSNKYKISFWKLTFLIIIASTAFYIVYPKYTFVNQGCGLRVNKITGEVCEVVDVNNYGVLQFGKRPKKS